MKKILFSVVMTFAGLTMFLACANEGKRQADAGAETTQEQKTVSIPPFNRDSAYLFVERQMAFGPRVPGSTGHAGTKDYLVEELGSFGLNPVVQEFSATHYTGEVLEGYNIIGTYNEKATKRILLMAHWDTRFTSDYDPDTEKHERPVPGANDGASGVAVLLEIARTLQAHPVDIGVDIVFFDLEDQGEKGSNDPTTWCLGSQYWARNLHRSATAYEYGILLDMVGAKNAQFKYEAFSMKYAPSVMKKVWDLASAMGYGNFFVKENIGAVTDDHYFVNVLAGIPSIDIIDKRGNTSTGFFRHWHTTHDTMDKIDKATLRAVGQVITALIYKESVDAVI